MGHATEIIQPAKIFVDPLFEIIRQLLQIVGAPQRSDCLCDTRLVRNNLLGTQGNMGRLFRRLRECLVKRIGIERLRAP